MSSAADLVRETKASIAEAQAAVASLTAERAGLALAAARGDRGAAAKSAKLRERIAAASDRIEDLTGLLPDLAGYVRLEEAAADHGADRERRRRARHIAEAHVRAAQAVDEAVAALAVAMQVADRAAALAHVTAAPLLGTATAALTTQTAADPVIGQLVRFGALGTDHLPPVYTGEWSYVRPLADAARRHLALVERHMPAEPVAAEIAA